jgi:hypothetical protein
MRVVPAAPQAAGEGAEKLREGQGLAAGHGHRQDGCGLHRAERLPHAHFQATFTDAAAGLHRATQQRARRCR